MMTYAAVALVASLYCIAVAVNDAYDIREKAEEIRERDCNK